MIDAAGQWIMPGLIDAHVHLSYGYPNLPGEGAGAAIVRPELNTLKAARARRRCCAPASPASPCRAAPISSTWACARRCGSA